MAARTTRRASTPKAAFVADAPAPTTRPGAEIHWGFPVCLDPAIPQPERDELIAWCGRFTAVHDQRTAGLFIAGPDTTAEVRRDVWARGGNLLELAQLRAQTPPDDHAARSERLARALAEPCARRWYEAAMLLATWDPAGRADAIAAAERLLAAWPAELRTRTYAFSLHPALQPLVRVHEGDASAVAAGRTVLRTRDLAGLRTPHATITCLELGEPTAIAGLIAGCAALPRLERLVLRHPGRDGTLDLAALLAAPALRGLTALSLEGFTLQPWDVEALAECPQPLAQLRLVGARLPPESGPALAALVARKPLRTLDLRDNELGTPGACALFGDPDRWRSLQLLDLSHNSVGDAGVAALARADLSALRWLDLSLELTTSKRIQALTAAGARSLAEAPALTALETLHLQFQPIAGAGVAALLRSPGLRSLRALDAAYARVKLVDLAAADPTDPPPLHHLRLDRPERSRKKYHLEDATFLRGVRSLHLGQLDGSEYAAVLTCPHLAALERLALGHPDSGVKPAIAALTTLAPPPALRWLDLGGWPVDADLATNLARSPLGRQLWGLRLTSPATTADAWDVLQRAGLPLLGSAQIDCTIPAARPLDGTTFREEFITTPVRA